MWRAAAALMVGGMVCLTGCTTFLARDPELARGPVPAAIPDDQWPARKTDGLAERVNAGNGSGRPQGASGAASSPPDGGGRGPRVAFTGVYGKGILRVMEFPGGDEDPRNKVFGSMRFTSWSLRSDKPADQRFTRYFERERRAAELHAKAAGVTLNPSNFPFSNLFAEGTSIRLIPPTGQKPACGTIVYIAGLGSATYEQPLIDELGRRGWWLVKIGTPRVWWYEAKPWMIESREDVPRVAEKLAAVMDDLVAEPAYAAEAALAYLEEHRPEIPVSPMVMMGCSAGALASVPVVARMPEKFDAAVLVGGGANLLEISQKSDLTDGGIHLAWPDGQPRGEWREELFRDYLKYSKLDPYHTAAYLRDKPTLMVQANLDLTVPAHNGWLLWDRLGRPDRYEHVGEHRTLFLTLGGQSKRIADWLDVQMKKMPKREPVTHGVPAVEPRGQTEGSGERASGVGTSGGAAAFGAH